MTDSNHAPWWIVPSDDKKRTRINCISYILQSIPYEHQIREPDSKAPEAAVGLRRGRQRPPRRARHDAKDVGSHRNRVARDMTMDQTNDVGIGAKDAGQIWIEARAKGPVRLGIIGLSRPLDACFIAPFALIVVWSATCRRAVPAVQRAVAADRNRPVIAKTAIVLACLVLIIARWRLLPSISRTRWKGWLANSRRRASHYRSRLKAFAHGLLSANAPTPHGTRWPAIWLPTS